jgi:hypothetical protein
MSSSDSTEPSDRTSIAMDAKPSPRRPANEPEDLMSFRVQAGIVVVGLGIACALSGYTLAAAGRGAATPSSSFVGTTSSGAGGSSSFTGAGTSGGSGEGNDGGRGSDDSGQLGQGGDGGGGSASAAGGMTVPAVRQLQAELARLGYFHHVVTGYYGNVTTAAVKRFQRSAGLTPDGIWGPRSEAALARRLAG